MRRIAAAVLSLVLILTTTPTLAKSYKQIQTEKARAAELAARVKAERPKFVRQGIKPLSDRATEDQRRKDQKLMQEALEGECADKGLETPKCMNAVRARIQAANRSSLAALRADSSSSKSANNARFTRPSRRASSSKSSRSRSSSSSSSVLSSSSSSSLASSSSVSSSAASVSSGSAE